MRSLCQYATGGSGTQGSEWCRSRGRGWAAPSGECY
jgi:hypothetical protein